MRTALAAVLLVLVAAASVVVFAPAALLDGRIAEATGGRLRLADAKGTLWRGQAVVATPDGRLRAPLEWRVDPRALASGELRVALSPVSADGAMPRGRIVLAADALRVESVRLSLPAVGLATAASVQGLTAGGWVEVDVDRLALARDVERGTARLAWQGARLALPGRPIVDLGTVQATLAAKDGALRGPVEARGGWVRVDGEATLGTNGLQLSVRLRPETWATSGERAVLAAIGTANADGSVDVAFPGRPR